MRGPSPQPGHPKRLERTLGAVAPTSPRGSVTCLGTNPTAPSAGPALLLPPPGFYVRVGPNPLFQPVAGYHWWVMGMGGFRGGGWRWWWWGYVGGCKDWYREV